MTKQQLRDFVQGTRAAALEARARADRMRAEAIEAEKEALAAEAKWTRIKERLRAEFGEG